MFWSEICTNNRLICDISKLTIETPNDCSAISAKRSCPCFEAYRLPLPSQQIRVPEVGTLMETWMELKKINVGYPLIKL